LNHKKELTNPDKKADISKILPLRPSKKILAMYYKDKEKNLVKQANIQNGWSYAQVFLASVKNIVKIKEMFLNLLTKKIEEV